MKRVEIEGQFDVNNPWTFVASSKGPLRVCRQQVSGPDQPSNWNSFCDEVDKTLEQLQSVKKVYRTTSIIILLFFVFAISSQIWIRMLPNPGFVAMTVVPIVVFSSSFFFISAFCWMLAKLKRAFGEVSNVCARYSVPNLVQYELRDEWWGGCSKFNSRRRFLIVTVHIDDVEQQQQQQQQQPEPVGNASIQQTQIIDTTSTTTTSDSFNTNAQNNEGTNNSSSLFSQLASEIK